MASSYHGTEGSSLTDCSSVVTIQRSESTRQLMATEVREKSPKSFSKKFLQVLEFIGHQETSSGCGLMGLGEKILSHERSLEKAPGKG